MIEPRYAGLAAYFPAERWKDRGHGERFAALAFDPRWPVVPAYAALSGQHKRDDVGAKRMSAKTGPAYVREALQAETISRVRFHSREKSRVSREARRAYGVPEPSRDVTWMSVDAGTKGVGWAFEAACTLEVLCRPADAASFADTVALLHDLVTAVGARTGTLGIWPSYDLALHDATLTRTILDTRWGEHDISLPPGFSEQVQLVQSERKFVGTTYARHPRWGTYLNAAHVAAVGGVERIRAEVAPAQIAAVGDLTYIQLTESWETALTAEAEQRRQALERVMAPIVVRA